MEPAEPIEGRLARIESMLAVLVERQHSKEWYTTEEFSRLVGKAEFTVREHCRHGRLRAKKSSTGRGPFQPWVISHEELLRYQRDGLLPREAAEAMRPVTCYQIATKPKWFAG